MAMAMAVAVKMMGKPMGEAAETGAPHAARSVGGVAGRGKAGRIRTIMAAASRQRLVDRQASCCGSAHEQQHNLA